MWMYLVTESFCMSDTDEAGKYPCGQEFPTHFCLLEHVCPYYGWTKATLRQGALQLPLHLIVKDKAEVALEKAWDNLKWFCWWQLPFNKGRIDAVVTDEKGRPVSNDLIKVVEEVDEDIENAKKAKAKFESWMKKITETDMHEYFACRNQKKQIYAK